MRFKAYQKVGTPYGPGIIVLIEENTSQIMEYWVDFEYTTSPKCFTEGQLREM